MKIDKKLSQKHLDEMQKLFEAQVTNEKDKKKANANFDKLAAEEEKWLDEHPGYPRFFSPLNDDVNPMVWNFPDASKIVCKGCAFVDKGLGGVTKAFCQVYQYPNMKPDNILWSNAKCEYRVDEKKAKKSQKKD